MFRYMDSDPLSAREKIRCLITDMDGSRGVPDMLIDEAESGEAAERLEEAGRKVEKAVEDLEAAALAAEEDGQTRALPLGQAYLKGIQSISSSGI